MGAGSSRPKLLNISANCGTTQITKPAAISTIIVSPTAREAPSTIDAIAPSRARSLFDERVSTPSLRRQMEMTEAVMGALALRLGRTEASWRTVGLLHNLDYDRVKEPERHCLVAAEALRAEGMVVGGNYGALAGKVFRIGHMGSQADLSLVRRGMDMLEMVLGTR